MVQDRPFDKRAHIQTQVLFVDRDLLDHVPGRIQHPPGLDRLLRSGVELERLVRNTDPLTPTGASTSIPNPPNSASSAISTFGLSLVTTHCGMHVIWLPVSFSVSARYWRRSSSPICCPEIMTGLLLFIVRFLLLNKKASALFY
jgi:hypothetical protein